MIFPDERQLLSIKINPASHSTAVPHESLTLNGSSAPWGNLRDVGASAALRKMSVVTTRQARPVSPSQLSPPAALDVVASNAVSVSSPNSNGMAASRSAPFSPQSNSSSLPSHPSLPSRPRPYSPGNEGQVGNNAPPASSSCASSVSGSQAGNDDELSRSVAALAVSTAQGSMSPQLPSPASGASSGAGRNSGDQNPPVCMMRLSLYTWH